MNAAVAVALHLSTAGWAIIPACKVHSVGCLSEVYLAQAGMHAETCCHCTTGIQQCMHVMYPFFQCKLGQMKCQPLSGIVHRALVR